MEKEERKNFNELIGRIGDRYYFLDSLFKHSDSFKGATAHIVEMVSKSEYEDRKDPTNLEDEYKYMWKDAVANDQTEESLSEWVRDLADDDEFIFDTSFYECAEKLRELFPKFNYEDYPIHEGTGCGRSFSVDMEWDELYNEELWEEIKKYEGSD